MTVSHVNPEKIGYQLTNYTGGALSSQIKAPHCVIGPRAACSLTFTPIIMRSVTTDYPVSSCVSLSVTRLHSPKTVERFAVCGRDYC